MVHFSVSVGVCGPLSPFTNVGRVRSSSRLSSSSDDDGCGLLGIGGAVLLGEGWRVLDPLAAVVVSFFILKVSVSLFVPSMEELLERSLPEAEEEKIRQTILAHPGCHDPHNLRTRRIGTYAAIDVHFRMKGSTTIDEAHQATRDIEDRLREEFGQETFITTHVEPLK